MRERFHLSNSAVFAVMWVSLSALVWHDISLRNQHQGGSGTSISERVITKEFTLVDDSGTTRARIGMSDKTNAPCVQLFDAAGAQRAQLRLNKDDVPSLRLYGGDGKIKSVVGFTLNDMRPTFVTFDPNGVGHTQNRDAFDPYVPVQDEDLSGGRYVHSYHGTVDLYSGQTITQQDGVVSVTLQNNAWCYNGNPQFLYDQQAQARAELSAPRRNSPRSRCACRPHTKKNWRGSRLNSPRWKRNDGSLQG